MPLVESILSAVVPFVFGKLIDLFSGREQRTSWHHHLTQLYQESLNYFVQCCIIVVFAFCFAASVVIHTWKQSGPFEVLCLIVTVGIMIALLLFIQQKITKRNRHRANEDHNIPISGSNIQLDERGNFSSGDRRITAPLLRIDNANDVDIDGTKITSRDAHITINARGSVCIRNGLNERVRLTIETCRELRVTDSVGNVCGQHGAILTVKQCTNKVELNGNIDGHSEVSVRCGGDVIVGGKVDGSGRLNVEQCGAFILRGRIDGGASCHIARCRGDVTVNGRIDGHASLRIGRCQDVWIADRISGDASVAVSCRNFTGYWLTCRASFVLTCTGTYSMPCSWYTGNRSIVRDSRYENPRKEDDTTKMLHIVFSLLVAAVFLLLVVIMILSA